MAVTSYSPQLLQLLDEALAATVRFGVRNLGAAKWNPTSGSEASREIADARASYLPPAHGEAVPRTAYAAANLLMGGVLDDLYSLQTLLGETMPVIGSTVVARSAIEIAATVWWLMEPGIGLHKRACRELVLSLTSARRAEQVAKLVNSAAGTNITLGHEADVLNRMATLGLTATAGTSPSVGGEALPTATDGTTAMLRPGLSARHAPESVYRVYSAVTHGQIYALVNFFQPSPSGNALQWALTGQQLDNTVQLAILAFNESYQRIRTVMGWGRLEYDLWYLRMNKIFGSYQWRI
jgi:hypothetical protein